MVTHLEETETFLCVGGFWTDHRRQYCFSKRFRRRGWEVVQAGTFCELNLGPGSLCFGLYKWRTITIIRTQFWTEESRHPHQAAITGEKTDIEYGLIRKENYTEIVECRL